MIANPKLIEQAIERTRREIDEPLETWQIADDSRIRARMRLWSGEISVRAARNLATLTMLYAEEEEIKLVA
jgi:hypothetical protein